VRLISLAVHWEDLFAQPVTAPALPPAERGQEVVALRDGLVARQMISATLSGGARTAPVGNDRPADGKLLAEVARRTAELDKRQHDLDTRAGEIDAEATLAKQQIAALTKLRTEIEGLVVHETTAADADLDMLVGLYSNMKPPQAAAVLGKLEPAKAGMILQKLGDRAGGPILAAMDPSAALAITEDIAQRRASFRK
jgi:flagellar motility protein MotE (MotC chaperone)